MPEDSPETKRKYWVIAEHVDAAADQILEAARTGSPNRVKAVLMYWFSILYDEGSVRVSQLTQEVELLQKLNEKIKSGTSWKRPTRISTMPPPMLEKPKKSK